MALISCGLGLLPQLSTVRRSIMARAAATPSWETLSQALVEEVQTVQQRLVNAKRRDFGVDGEECRVVFYRDNSSWCPYCERVWIQLEEKKIPYRVEKINMNCYGQKQRWYLDMVPSGLLPAVQLDGRLITESLDILLALEEAFPDKQPLPSSARRSLNMLLKLERRLASVWLSRLRSNWGDFGAAMDSVEAALAASGGPYFLGAELSLADAAFAPFLERIAASMPYWQGLQVRGNAERWPRLQAWFDAMDGRPSYMAIKSDDFTITHTLEPQIGRCMSMPAGEAYRALVNGQDGSWDLPLRAECTAWGSHDGGPSGRREAATMLVSNHQAVVDFAMRSLSGSSKQEECREAVDEALRLVAHTLLLGTVDNVVVPEGKEAAEVAAACAYLRDRVGVPRDLAYPAARHLRGHLQWLVTRLKSSASTRVS